MNHWTSEELNAIGGAEELRVASLRRDGTLRNTVIVWVVRHGDDVYVRSVNGPTGAWYRGAQARHQGRIRAGGIDKDVTFIDADHGLDDQIDTAYRAKYRRYAASIVGSVTTPQARATTTRLLPR
jgi:hypothetical protein